MSIPANALPTYERLRTEVLNGQARPEGLAAVAYHGMLRGLAVILAEVCDVSVRPPSPSASVSESTLDRDLLRLLANMVLQSQSQLMHVY